MFMKNTLKKRHVNSSWLKSNENHKFSFIKYQIYSYVYTVQGKWASSTTASSSLFRFENINSFIGNIRRVDVSHVLLLIVVMIATKPRNSQRPTISSYRLGCPPSLAKLREATEYSSLFFFFFLAATSSQSTRSNVWCDLFQSVTKITDILNRFGKIVR